MQNRIGGYLAGAIPADVTRKESGKYDKLPQKVDLRDHLTEVEMQVGNSCVANAFAGAYEYLAKRTNGESSDVSRLYIYYNARWLEDSQAAVSLALLPLRVGPVGNVAPAFGLLVLASPDAQRFNSGMGTDFLQHIAELASAALSRLR